MTSRFEYKNHQFYSHGVEDFLRVVVWLVRPGHVRATRVPAEFIIFDTKFLVFDTQSLVFDIKLLVLNAKFIVFNHVSVVSSCLSSCLSVSAMKVWESRPAAAYSCSRCVKPWKMCRVARVVWIVTISRGCLWYRSFSVCVAPVTIFEISWSKRSWCSMKFGSLILRATSFSCKIHHFWLKKRSLVFDTKFLVLNAKFVIVTYVPERRDHSVQHLGAHEQVVEQVVAHQRGAGSFLTVVDPHLDLLKERDKRMVCVLL